MRLLSPIEKYLGVSNLKETTGDNSFFRKTDLAYNGQFQIKLAQHAYSGLFGTFLFNSRRESKMMKEEMKEEPVSIWRFLGKHNEQVVSSLYDKAIVGRITFDTEMSTLREWIEVYRDRAFDDDIVSGFDPVFGMFTTPGCHILCWLMFTLSI